MRAAAFGVAIPDVRHARKNLAPQMPAASFLQIASDAE
jgi:hypothetical protein